MKRRAEVCSQISKLVCNYILHYIVILIVYKKAILFIQYIMYIYYKNIIHVQIT